MALIAGLIVSLGACAPTKPKVNKEADEAARRGKADQAVQQGVDKEKAPLGTIARRPTSGTQRLRTGDTIWLQSGKSRVLELPYKVTRVSIGNPDLAGVVVLGPRSILVNAKEVPSSDQNTGGTMQAPRAGILSSRTFTPPPKMAETSIILWDSANHTDSHTVFVTDFLAEQVLLEVTIAELNRTKMEQRGVDFQKISGSIRAGYWLGGGEALGITQFLPAAGLEPVHSPPFPLATGSEHPTFAFQNGDSNITALVTMLEQNGLATILAQPKIMALSGQNAVFQVGGEIPIRIVTSFSAEVEFKAFGTLVNFIPRISEDGDIVLTVTPEVSQPDFNSLVEACPRS
jgi:pilus assembly protein CpaC